MKKGTIKVSVFYPNGDGNTFDLDYYCNKHMPMVSKLLGGALKSTSVDKGIVGATPDQPALYSAIGNLYFDSIADFQTSFGPHAEKIMADAANYTNTQPAVQISEVQ
tara:strand:+ start:410 stop:730 length:321 start_codon:yes stop_codon:yes gene_type:complete